MCVIIYKPAGVKIPSDDIMWDCWTTNPDGAGYMYKKNNEVVISKGFMDLYDLTAALAVDPEVTTENEVCIHFRIGTSGKNDGPTTHPFPVTDSIKLLQKLEVCTTIGVAHNGVISQPTGILSDTQIFIKDVLSKPVVRDNIDDDTIQELISEYINSSRLLIMRGQGDTIMIGNWSKSEGVYYSNNNHSYKPHWQKSYRFTPSKQYPITSVNKKKEKEKTEEIITITKEEVGDYISDRLWDCPVCDGMLNAVEDEAAAFYQCAYCCSMIDAWGNLMSRSY